MTTMKTEMTTTTSAIELTAPIMTKKHFFKTSLPYARVKKLLLHFYPELLLIEVRSVKLDKK